MISIHFKKQQGSSLLTVLFIITLVHFFCLSIWRIVIISFDISLKKQEYEQQCHAMHAQLNWAIDLCQNNFMNLAAYLSTVGHDITITHSLGINNIPYTADIIFRSNNSEIIDLKTKLHRQKTLVCCMQCSITKLAEKRYKISKWTMNIT